MVEDDRMILTCRNKHKKKVASLLNILHNGFIGYIVQILFVCNNDCANIGLDLKVYLPINGFKQGQVST